MKGAPAALSDDLHRIVHGARSCNFSFRRINPAPLVNLTLSDTNVLACRPSLRLSAEILVKIVVMRENILKWYGAVSKALEAYNV